MSKIMKKKLGLGVAVGLLVMVVLVVTGCGGGPGGDCSDCHNDTTLVYSKSLQSATTTHQTGGAYGRGTRAGCAACHSSEGFQEMVAMGVGVDGLEEGIANPSPPNCRTCHQIHTTYTEADWALETTAPVTLLASGETFDAGDGNLCANCHQPRRLGPEEGSGDYEITSSHWGPHHGPQSTVLLGVSAYGVPDSTSIHYTVVDDGCPVCHVSGGDHTFEATEDGEGCQSCHVDLDTLDRNGVQTEIKALFEELGELLEAAGPIHEGHPNPGTYSEGLAGAAWNYMIVYEDNSWGIHNPSWTKAILEKGIELAE